MKARLINETPFETIVDATVCEAVLVDSTLHAPGYLPSDVRITIRGDRAHRVIVSIQGGKVSMQPRAAGIWLEIEASK